MSGGDIFVLLSILTVELLRFPPVVTTQFLDDLVNPCTELAAAKAKESVDSGKYQQHLIDTQLAAVSQKQQQNYSTADIDDEARGDRKDDRRRKAAGGKAGGGAQGRETKTKSTKKHYRGGRNAANQSDSEDESAAVSVPTSSAGAGANKRAAPPARLELIKAADIKRIIAPRLDEEGLDHLTATLAAHYVPQFARLALAQAQTLHAATVQQNAHAAQSAHQDRRQTHAALQERLNNALVDVRLYERGLKLLPAAQHAALIKYLLRTLATDVANELHAYAAAESSGATVPANVVWTPELRTKIVQECGEFGGVIFVIAIKSK